MNKDACIVSATYITCNHKEKKRL